MKIISSIVIILLTTIATQAAGLVFTFANGTFTGTSPKYYEFDVMVAADISGTRLGDNLVYLNYDIEGFGSSIVSAGKVEVTKSTLLEGGSAPSFYYDIVNVADNTPSRMAITSEYNYPDYPEYGNEVPTVATPLLHVKIEVLDENKITISFEQPLMVGQQYESDNTTKYDPITAGDVISDLEQSAADLNRPDCFMLEQNYPNPFNPKSTIKYAVHKQTHVVIVVYNTFGQRVINLVNEFKLPGYYEVNWEGKNRDGIDVASGLYFYTLRTNKFTKTMKMLLVR